MYNVQFVQYDEYFVMFTELIIMCELQVRRTGDSENLKLDIPMRRLCKKFGSDRQIKRP